MGEQKREALQIPRSRAVRLTKEDTITMLEERQADSQLLESTKDHIQNPQAMGGSSQYHVRPGLK